MNLDEYLINRLEKLEKENEELKSQIIKQKEEIEKPKEFEIVGANEDYYYINHESYSYLNGYLKANNLNPDYLKECLEDDEKMSNLLTLKKKSSYGGVDKLATINQYSSDITFVGYNKGCLNNSMFALNYKDNVHVYLLDNEEYTFSSREKAEKELKEVMKNEIEEYFKTKKQKEFEESEKE